jgi:hypothetical protein
MVKRSTVTRLEKLECSVVEDKAYPGALEIGRELVWWLVQVYGPNTDEEQSWGGPEDIPASAVKECVGLGRNIIKADKAIEYIYGGDDGQVA